MTTVGDVDKGGLPTGVTLATLSHTAEKLTREQVCKDKDLAGFVAHGGRITNTVKLQDGTLISKPSVTRCD